jgi:Ca2+-binding EF-hand superfamily protein
MRALTAALSIILVLGLCRASFAQQDPPPPAPVFRNFQMPTFADLDKNKDKKITRDELPGQFPAQAFDRMDENKDGFIDEEEWTRRQRGGGGMGGPRIGEQLIGTLDANADGKVTREEFGRILEVFEILDKDGNAEVSGEEMGRFLQAANELKSRATGGVEIDRLFQKLDKDKDSKITADEMANEKTFKALDLNKDGFITREEATKATKQLNERSKEKREPPPPAPVPKQPN